MLWLSCCPPIAGEDFFFERIRQQASRPLATALKGKAGSANMEARVIAPKQERWRSVSIDLGTRYECLARTAKTTARSRGHHLGVQPSVLSVSFFSSSFLFLNEEQSSFCLVGTFPSHGVKRRYGGAPMQGEE